MNRGKAYRQVFALQDVLYAEVLNPLTPAREKAACARAWDVLEDRKRELRGKAPLKPQDPSPKKRQFSGLTRPAPAWSEPKPTPI